MKITLILTLLAVLGCSHLSYGGSSTIKVSSGNCKLEKTGEIISFNNVDPRQHYGMFATATSKEGDNIYLALGAPNEITINMNSNFGNGYSTVNLNQAGETLVKTGLFLKNSNDNLSQWLSCELKVSQ